MNVNAMNVAIIIQDGETKEVLQTMSDNILATLLSTEDGGVSDQDEFQLFLYPNPASTSFQILTDGLVQEVELYDMQGRLMKTYSAGVLNYDIADLFPGTYIVRIQTLNGFEQRKIVKQ